MSLGTRGGFRRRQNTSKRGGSSCMCGDHSAGNHKSHKSHKKSKRSSKKRSRRKRPTSKRSSKKRSRRKTNKSGGFIRDRSVQMFVRSSGRRA